jgi:hypothetical protein
MFDLHPVVGRAKNDLTKAFVNSAAVSAINTIALSSMIAYVAVARLAKMSRSTQVISSN